MMSGLWIAFDMKKPSIRILGSLLVTGMLVSCATDGRITDFVPSALFLKHNEDSAYPNINSVPQKPDARLQKFSTADPEITNLRQELESKKDALEQSNPPEQRIYNDPKWSLDE